jgi:uncharacterized protein (TIGR02145 family)
MKKLFTLLALIVITTINAQAPQGFNYQATVRNSAGALIINQNVLFKFNIMLNSQTSLPVYSETHQAPTDDLGQVNLVIGTGTATTGTFSAINWGNGNYFLGIELNIGSGYVAMGTTQLLSVPYALYANTAGSTSSNNTGVISPTITTNQVANSNTLNPSFSANISNVNMNQLSRRAGFVYSISPNPILDSYGDGNVMEVTLISNTFTFEADGYNGWPFFLSDTLYYVRAFVITENNTIVYGNEVTFTAHALPLSPENLEGNPISINGVHLIWIDRSNNETGFKIERKLDDGAFEVIGTTAENITTFDDNGLTPCLAYTYRVYSYNADGNSVYSSNELPLNTGTILPNITIGNQTWTTINLDIETYSDGTPIPQVTDPVAWSNLTTGAWCYNNNDTATGAAYGKLYNWYAVAGIYDTASLSNPALRKKLAPTGWHIPSDIEWTIMIDYLGGETVAGGKMKSMSVSHWYLPNTDATNSSGFSGLPGGYRKNDGTYYNIGIYGYWWSSSDYNATSAWTRHLNYYGGTAYSYSFNKQYGHSVRCIKD